MANILIVVANTDVEQISTVAELMVAQSQLQVVDTGFQDRGLPTPEWVTDQMEAVGREINGRLSADIKRQLKADEARMEALQTRSEQRRALQDRINRNKEMLGKI